MIADSLSACRNLLEPEAYVRLFVDFPPEGFDCRWSAAGLPVFRTDFDLLTTLDAEPRAALKRLPFFALWSRLLRFATCFCGTTITEYAPVPAGAEPAELLRDLQAQAGASSLLILKDLPCVSPLLAQADNDYARTLADEARRQGFIEVEGQALAYVPVDFSSEEEYLSRLSSGRRKDLRRKLKKRALLSVETLPLGAEFFFNEIFLEQAYAMYLDVFRQSEIHFDLLPRDFFAALLQSRDIEGVVMLYRHEDALAGYNICLIHNGLLIDKYIGFAYPLARELNLYFISWLINLDYARRHGLSAYVAGWTDPEVKASLGARFTFTRHLVRVRNPLLRAVLFRLRHLFESDSRTLGGAR